MENTIGQEGKNVKLEDHLHIRGEYQFEDVLKAINQGSSPHTWRIHNWWTPRPYCNRIISTYVENTDAFFLYHLQKEDHLHIRGEYAESVRAKVKEEGSSPHTWRIRLYLAALSNA